MENMTITDLAAAALFWVLIGGVILWINRHKVVCVLVGHDWEIMNYKKYGDASICNRCDKIRFRKKIQFKNF